VFVPSGDKLNQLAVRYTATSVFDNIMIAAMLAASFSKTNVEIWTICQFVNSAQ